MACDAAIRCARERQRQNLRKTQRHRGAQRRGHRLEACATPRLFAAEGEHGVDGWIDDANVVAQVKELYPPSSVMRPRMEDDRRVFLAAMSKMKREMILGPDKNVYVEPTIWTIEWAQSFYRYPTTRSN